MTWDDYYKTLLALTAWREARGDGSDAMLAVMWVIKNRVDAKWGDWDHAITGKGQFSSLTVLGDSQTILWPDSPDDSFEKAMNLADLVFGGMLTVDPTHGALFYDNPKTATSGWFQKNVVNSPKYQKVATISHHDFYAPRISGVDFDAQTGG